MQGDNRPVSARHEGAPIAGFAILATLVCALQGCRGCQRAAGDSRSADSVPAADSGDQAWDGELPNPFGLYDGLNYRPDFQGSMEELFTTIEEHNLARMQALGMGVSRIHNDDGYISFSWKDVDAERDGQDLDFSYPDALAVFACDVDIRLVPTIVPGSRENRDAQQPFQPDPEAWAVFLETVVERYDGDDDYTPHQGVTDEPSQETRQAIQRCPIHSWVLGNELENVYEGDPSWCPPELYAETLAESTVLAHARDPEVQIIYGGLSWRAAYFQEQWSFVEETLGLLAEDPRTDLDAMGLHVYPWYLDLGDVSDHLDAVLALLPPDTPLWITESGFASQYTETNLMEDGNASQISQARQLLAFHPMVFARQGQGVLLFVVHDTGDDSRSFASYGLTSHEDELPWLSYHAYKQMIGLLADADWSATQIVEENQQGRFAYRMPRRGGGELILLVFEPAALDDYEPGGQLSNASVLFEIDELQGSQATVLQALPEGDSGEEIGFNEPSFSQQNVQIADGQLSLEVGPRPVWVITEE